MPCFTGEFFSGVWRNTLSKGLCDIHWAMVIHFVAVLVLPLFQLADCFSQLRLVVYHMVFFQFRKILSITIWIYSFTYPFTHSFINTEVNYKVTALRMSIVPGKNLSVSRMLSTVCTICHLINTP